MKTKLSFALVLVVVGFGVALLLVERDTPCPVSHAPHQSLARSVPDTPTSSAPAAAASAPAGVASLRGDAASRAAAGLALRSNPLEAPAWAVPYGKEFWRQPAAVLGVGANQSSPTNLPVSLNIGDVIDRVRHALIQGETAPGPQVAAQTYTASFDGRGLIFSPHEPSGPGAETRQDRPPSSVEGSAMNEGESDNPHLRTGPQRLGDAEGDRNVRGPQPDPETQFTLRTLSVRSGNAALYIAGKDPPEWSYLGNTGQALLNSQAGLIQHYELRSDGAHLTWVLRHKPAAAEPVNIEVAANGLSYAGQTVTGTHFSDAEGVARVRFGQAVVVDATGKTWPLVVTAQRSTLNPQHSTADSQPSTLNLCIPSTILAEAAYPLAVDPIISPEFGLDNPIYGLPLGSQNSPALAGNGTNWLVVWQDGRGAYPDIYGTRVSGDGEVLDSRGIPICTASCLKQAPSVAWNGTDWLVVWSDKRHGDANSDIYGARVNGNGEVVHNSEIAICTAANNQYSPSVAWNGSDWLVVWIDNRRGDGGDIYGARIIGSGVVLNPAGIAICTAANSQWWPDVAAIGTDWLVVWGDRRNDTGNGNSDIYGSRLDASGSVLNPGGMAICAAMNRQGAPAVAADGTNCLVVWEDGRNLAVSGDDVYGARINASGVVLDGGGFGICTAVQGQGSPAAAWNGTDWLVVWHDWRSGSNNDIYSARVNASGVVLDPAGSPICATPNEDMKPSVAASGTGWLVVWEHSREVTGYIDVDLRGVRVDGTGTVLDGEGLPITTTPNSERLPAVAANGSNWLVVWQDWRDADNGWPDLNIYGARVNPDGVILDTSGIAVSSAPNTQQYPSVAASGGDWLVVWEDLRHSIDNLNDPDIYGARVIGSGEVLDGSGIAISTAAESQRRPAAATGTSGWRVVWQDSRNWGLTDWDIYGTKVDENGIVLNPDGNAICTAVEYQENPSLAWNGTDWLVVWQDSRDTGQNIYGSRVNASGAVLDGAGFPICTAANYQLSPSVAWNRTHWLAVWSDEPNPATTRADIYGSRVTGAGLVVDPVGVAIGRSANGELAPSVAARGTNWVVVWEDSTLRDLTEVDSDIYGASVSGAGTIPGPGAFAIRTGSGFHRAPDVSELLGRLLVVYDGPDETGVRRIRANTLSELGPIPLTIQSLGSLTVLSWTNPAFVLQSAPTVSGVYTNVPGAISPHSNPMTGGRSFFRLMAIQ